MRQCSSREALARPSRKTHPPSSLRVVALRATGLRAARPRPAPSRTSRMKLRQVSSTNLVPPTSDFRTGNRCALVFRDFPFIDRTARRNCPSPARAPAKKQCCLVARQSCAVCFFTLPMTACPPPFTWICSMRISCCPPLHKRRRTSTCIA